MSGDPRQRGAEDSLSGEEDEDGDAGMLFPGGVGGALGEESYLGEPAADFDSSRADGIAAFRQGVGLGGESGGGYPGGGGAAGGGSGSLWAAWSDAASKGVKPMDFGFLMGSSGGAQPSDDVAEKNNDMQDAAIGSLEDSFGAGLKKRTRMDVEGPQEVSAAEAEHEASRGSAPMARAPPRPPRRPQEVYFGRMPGEDRGDGAMELPVKRTDPFHWMKGDGGEAPDEVIELLKEENRYAEAEQEHLKPLRDRLYAEMMGHQKEADMGLLWPSPGGYGYFTRTFTGKTYQAHYRKRQLPGGGWGEEELVLDENDIAIDPAGGSQRPYCSVSGPHPNRAHSMYAVGTDFAGNDSYTLHIRPFGAAAAAGLPDCSRIRLERTDGDVHWSPSGDRIYYTQLDSEFRGYKIKCHILGSDPHGKQDEVLFEEKNRKYWVSLSETQCARFLILTAMSAETMEGHLLDFHNPSLGLRRIAGRQFGHQYSVDHRGGFLWILTNKDEVKDSKICRVPLSALPDVTLADWEDVWVPGQTVKLEEHLCCEKFMVIQGRENGLNRIFVHNYGEGTGPPVHAVVVPDAAAHTGRMLTPRGAMSAGAVYSVGLGTNNLFQTDVLQYTYSSFIVPGITYEYHVESRKSVCLHMQETPNFDPDAYRSERFTSARRGVPISLVYRKDLHPKGLAGGPFPLLLTGYGAYGACQDPDFDGNRLSLLDRGMVYAVVHVRGGGEHGREWHEQGKNLKVKNRFADFLDAAETLVKLRITRPEKLCAWGTSSGGLLVSASINLRPDIFRAVLLEVPFVDALNTMGDPSIPLTIGEWEEIGNPNEREYFYYMLEYSPYDNVRMEAYPAALVTASLNDSMVGYWEPLKYVSKLRALKLDNRQVLLQTDFHAGHGATSNRYQGTRESAFQFAFLLDQLGLAEVPVMPTSMVT